MKVHQLQFTVEGKTKFRCSVRTPRVTVLECVPDSCTRLYSVHYSTILPLVFCLRAQTNTFAELCFAFYFKQGTINKYETNKRIR